MTSVKIACKNAPSRYGDADNDHDIQRLANRGNVVIAGSEINDSDAFRLCPRGYSLWRPTEARSEVLYWSPEVWRRLHRDAIKISSSHAPADRYIVELLLEHRETEIIRRFGAVHLVAFKTRNKAHAREYRYQIEGCAEWLASHPRGALLGDFNGSFKGNWMDPLKEVGEVHTPVTHSGPEGQNIDLIITNKAIAHANRAKALNGFDGDHKPVEATLPLRKG